MCVLKLVSVGVVPVVVKPPAPSNLQGSLPAMKLTIELSNSRAILSTHNVLRVLKSKVSHRGTLRHYCDMINL